MGVPLDPSKIRAARQDAGLGLAVTAAQIGISHGHLSNVERGRRRLSPLAAGALATLLGTSIAALRP